MQNKKIREIKEYWYSMRYSNTFLQLAKGTVIGSRVIAKGAGTVFKYPFEEIACGIRELHAKQILIDITGTAGRN